MSDVLRALLLSILMALLVAACGEDKVDGVVDPGDVDATLEILVPDGVAETMAPDSAADTSGDDAAPCPGCTGSPCSNNTDCNSGFCLEGPNGLECVRTCSDECATGYACRGVTNAGGDPTFLCLYEHITLCAPCDVDGDCETGIGGLSGAKCLPGDDAAPEAGRFCRTPCTPGSCPSGSTCEEVSVDGRALMLCRRGAPNAPAPCTCSARSAALALGTSCRVANELGSCEGERVCAAVGPVPACDAAEPVAELCNDRDDDCDGETDEDFPQRGEPCDGDDADLCEGGIWVCAPDGALRCTDDANSEVERCDGIDNDCDGETDEDFPGIGEACDGPDTDTCKDGVMACDGLALVCNDGPETATDGIELCNGVDDNCNIEVDEGFEDKGQPCDGDDADGCKDGFFVCSPDGLSLVCNDDAASRVELCNELDDDCQNGPDDTFPDKFKPCDGPDQDLCPDGIWVCSPDQTGLACTDDAISKVELCNDLDDDCDGETDEDFPLKGEACDSEIDTDLCATGRWVCGNNTLVCDDDAASEIEVCNGEDDDCDGLTDQMDGDLADELNSNQQGACAGSLKACAGAAGYVDDYSSVPTYGLAETPDGSYLDENCDGIDGDEARAVFVKKGSPDSGACTKAAPCGSINFALSQTSPTKNHVYVQAGRYDEIVEIGSGKNVEIYGGFNASWVRKARTELGHKVELRGAKHAGDGEYVTVRVRNATLKLADLVVIGVSPGSEERKNGQGLSSYAVHAVGSEVRLERVEVLQGSGATGADGTPGQDAPSLTAPAKAATGGGGEQELSLCDDTTRGQAVNGQANPVCSDGTAGGKSGQGGTMDTDCVCDPIFGSGLCVCSPCDPTSGSSGSAGQGTAAGAGGGGSGACAIPEPGAPGGTPSHGVGGDGGARGGAINAGYWYGGAGGGGGLGQNGSGGGGGGGSGGCDDGRQVPLQNSSGAGGGGGGAGGCRAQAGGAGGKPGGSSFGVLATSGSIQVRASRFVLGNGGAGGRGGLGGNGQPGGEGGEGGSSSGDARPGGRGGKGGDGGASGGGGGGAGGNSFGVYTQNSSVDVDGSNDFSGGSAGPRGEGGSAPTAAGVNGAGKPGQAGRVDSVATCVATSACGD